MLKESKRMPEIASILIQIQKLFHKRTPLFRMLLHLNIQGQTLLSPFLKQVLCKLFPLLLPIMMQIVAAGSDVLKLRAHSELEIVNVFGELVKRLEKLIFSVDAAEERNNSLSKRSDLGNWVQHTSNDSRKLHD